MSEKTIHRKVVILGSGPAGLTAAVYAGRAQLEPLVIDGPQPGGQLTITTDVENYPGFSKGIMGPILMDEFREQALRFGTEIINTWIDRVDLSARPFTLYGKDSEDSTDVTTVIKAESLIISTGASAKNLCSTRTARISPPEAGSPVLTQASRISARSSPTASPDTRTHLRKLRERAA